MWIRCIISKLSLHSKYSIIVSSANPCYIQEYYPLYFNDGSTSPILGNAGNNKITAASVSSSSVAYGGKQYSAIGSSYTVFAGYYDDTQASNWLKSISSTNVVIKEIISIVLYPGWITFITFRLAVITVNMADGSLIYAKIIDNTSTI